MSLAYKVVDRAVNGMGGSEKRMGRIEAGPKALLNAHTALS